MAIDIEALTKADVGRWVLYMPSGKTASFLSISFHGEVERGRVKSWNDKWVFVVYCLGQYAKFWQNYTGAATNPEDLEWVWPGEELT